MVNSFRYMTFSPNPRMAGYSTYDLTVVLLCFTAALHVDLRHVSRRLLESAMTVLEHLRGRPGRFSRSCASTTCQMSLLCDKVGSVK
ncbi:hypothetical protein BDW75DRAFT_225902 [Aspergillus navahoensis]